jgi:hypothetical protein
MTPCITRETAAVAQRIFRVREFIAEQKKENRERVGGGGRTFVPYRRLPDSQSGSVMPASRFLSNSAKFHE